MEQILETMARLESKLDKRDRQLGTKIPPSRPEPDPPDGPPLYTATTQPYQPPPSPSPYTYQPQPCHNYPQPPQPYRQQRPQSYWQHLQIMDLQPPDVAPPHGMSHQFGHQPLLETFPPCCPVMEPRDPYWVPPPNLNSPHARLPTCWDRPQVRQPYYWELNSPAPDIVDWQQPRNQVVEAFRQQHNPCSGAHPWQPNPLRNHYSEAPWPAADPQPPQLPTTQSRNCHGQPVAVLQPLLHPTSLCLSTIVPMVDDPAVVLPPPVISLPCISDDRYGSVGMFTDAIDELMQSCQIHYDDTAIDQLPTRDQVGEDEKLLDVEEISQLVDEKQFDLDILDVVAQTNDANCPRVDVSKPIHANKDGIYGSSGFVFLKRELLQEVVNDWLDILKLRKMMDSSLLKEDRDGLYVTLHLKDVASMNHRSTSLDADARLIPPRVHTPCFGIIGRDVMLHVLALNYHDTKGPQLLIFYGDDEGRRSFVRCAFDPGIGASPKLLLSTHFIATWFPP